MTKGRKKAIETLAESLRKYFSEDAGLSDRRIVAKYVKEEQVGHLAGYYDALFRGLNRLKKANRRMKAAA